MVIMTAQAETVFKSDGGSCVYEAGTVTFDKTYVVLRADNIASFAGNGFALEADPLFGCDDKELWVQLVGPDGFAIWRVPFFGSGQPARILKSGDTIRT